MAVGRCPIQRRNDERPPDAGAPVARVITRLNIGGPARQALLLTRELRPEFQTILAAGKPEPAEGELQDPEVAVHPVSLVRQVQPNQDVRAFMELRSLFESARPRVVHTHMAKAGALGRAAALSMPRRPKLVHTFHGHVLQGYFGSLAEKAFLNVERVLARRTDVLIAISPQVKESLLALGVGREEQYRVVPLGFDLSEHLRVDGRSRGLRSQLGLAPDTPLVGSVGRLVPIKDLSTLLRAMAETPEAHLAVLGDGDSRQDLESLSTQLGVADRVHFIGWVRDIPTGMSDMDVVALSSLNEGTPVALIEAAACAKAVVATDVGGVRYVVDHGTTGFVCAPQAPDQLATHIKTLLRDADLRRRMGAAGRQKVRRLFHKDRLVQDIRDVYSDLLA